MKTDVYTVVLVALYLAIQWYLDSFTLVYILTYSFQNAAAFRWHMFSCSQVNFRLNCISYLVHFCEFTDGVEHLSGLLMKMAISMLVQLEVISNKTVPAEECLTINVIAFKTGCFKHN